MSDPVGAEKMTNDICEMVRLAEAASDRKNVGDYEEWFMKYGEKDLSRAIEEYCDSKLRDCRRQALADAEEICDQLYTDSNHRLSSFSEAAKAIRSLGEIA